MNAYTTQSRFRFCHHPQRRIGGERAASALQSSPRAEAALRAVTGVTINPRYSVPETGGCILKDMQAQLEKLRTDAAECALIHDLATDPKKRELFARLAEHLTALASAVERAIADRRDP